jgi:hypothetical protein
MDHFSQKIRKAVLFKFLFKSVPTIVTRHAVTSSVTGLVVLVVLDGDTSVSSKVKCHLLKVFSGYQLLLCTINIPRFISSVFCLRTDVMLNTS